MPTPLLLFALTSQPGAACDWGCVVNIDGPVLESESGLFPVNGNLVVLDDIEWFSDLDAVVLVDAATGNVIPSDVRPVSGPNPDAGFVIDPHDDLESDSDVELQVLDFWTPLALQTTSSADVSPPQGGTIDSWSHEDISSRRCRPQANYIQIELSPIEDTSPSFWQVEIGDTERTSSRILFNFGYPSIRIGDSGCMENYVLGPRESHTFRSRAVDIAGNHGEWSDPIVLTTGCSVGDTPAIPGRCQLLGVLLAIGALTRRSQPRTESVTADDERQSRRGSVA